MFFRILLFVNLYKCISPAANPPNTNSNTNINAYCSRTILRLTDADFDSLFTNAAVAKSRMRCIAFCLLSDTNTYYDESTRRCTCSASCYVGYSMTTGGNYVLRYNTLSKLLYTFHIEMTD